MTKSDTTTNNKDFSGRMCLFLLCGLKFAFFQLNVRVKNIKAVTAVFRFADVFHFNVGAERVLEAGFFLRVS